MELVKGQHYISTATAWPTREQHNQLRQLTCPSPERQKYDQPVIMIYNINVWTQL